MRIAAALMLAAASACGGDPAPAAPRDGVEQGGAPGAADDARAAAPVDAATAGSIAGVVRFTGPDPAVKTFTPAGEAFCIRHANEHGGGTMRDESLLVDDGRVRNAFVWIAGGLAAHAYPEPAEPVLIDQMGCAFTPRVVGLQVRQTLLVGNSDPVMHNVHVKPSRGSDVNRGMPGGAKPTEMSFKREDVMMPLVCDVHSWMRGWIGVVEHPFFAVTGEDGAFRLEGVPPGSYTVEAWHETLGRSRAQVSVGEDQDVGGVELVFAPK